MIKGPNSIQCFFGVVSFLSVMSAHVHQDKPQGKDYGEDNAARTKTFFEPKYDQESAKYYARFSKGRQSSNRRD